MPKLWKNLGINLRKSMWENCGMFSGKILMHWQRGLVLCKNEVLHGKIHGVFDDIYTSFSVVFFPVFKLVLHSFHRAYYYYNYNKLINI